jgi:hypothetical protein
MSRTICGDAAELHEALDGTWQIVS